MKPFKGALGCITILLLGGVTACGSAKEEEPVAGDEAHFDAASAKDEEKNTHLFIVNHALKIVEKHGAANTVAWMNDKKCRENWQNGLLEADFLAPYNGGFKDLDIPDGHETSLENRLASADVLVSASTWMSHFYDPDTGTNYLGFKTSKELADWHPVGELIRAPIVKQQIETAGEDVPVEAKGSALLHLKRAATLLGGQALPKGHKDNPEDLRDRGCYELGIALHYVTDIAQPMHSANFAATAYPRLLHSHWEGFAEQIQKDFIAQDWKNGPEETDPDAVIQTIAKKSKSRWINGDARGSLQQAIHDAYLEKNEGEPLTCKVARGEVWVADRLGYGDIHVVGVDHPECWNDNANVKKETGLVLQEAQEHTARFIAVVSLPNHARR